jgi:hypothetical protein
VDHPGKPNFQLEAAGAGRAFRAANFGAIVDGELARDERFRDRLFIVKWNRSYFHSQLI